MGLRKVDHNFISDIDVALAEFDGQHALSDAQQREISKHQAVFAKRDTPTPAAEEKTDLWDF